jgi:hypothetical protein
MCERVVEVVAGVLRDTSWPSREPYPIALARDVLYGLEQAGFTVDEAGNGD